MAFLTAEPPVGTPASDVPPEPVGPVEPDSQSLAAVIDRLIVVFGAQVSTATIVRIVRRCRRELDIISGPPLAEMLERLAYQRLRNLNTPERRRAPRRRQLGSAT